MKKIGTIKVHKQNLINFCCEKNEYSNFWRVICENVDYLSHTLLDGGF